MDPYLRPLYDALYDLLDPEKVDKMLEKNVIEVAPLAFMRGRTLNDAFIIMDEAQNTTIEQMKMFLTRMGNNSKAVITGDITQIDLPNPRKSGLLDAINILDGVEGIHFCHFEDCDVVRHALVQRIVRAYESSSRSSRNCRWRSAKPSKSASRAAKIAPRRSRSIRPSRNKTVVSFPGPKSGTWGRVATVPEEYTQFSHRRWVPPVSILRPGRPRTSCAKRLRLDGKSLLCSPIGRTLRS